MPLLETKGAASAQGFGLTLQQAAANYIEDVFSTWLYTGNGSTQTITNGIDLAGKGGLVWIKGRSIGYAHVLVDTARGTDKVLCSNNTNAQQTSDPGFVTQFNTNGFAVGDQARVNLSSLTVASWTFREQPKFFDVVTYTGNGATSRNISHSLGSDPGCIIVKRTSGAGSNWSVYHRSTGTGKRLILNQTSAVLTDADWFASVTSTTFSVSGNTDANDNGETYVAYLFAHNAGGFGLTGTDNVITCGSFTTDGSGIATVTLGYEPQWVLIKNSGGADQWFLMDSMRGFTTDRTDAVVYPNTAGAEVSRTIAGPTSTGFSVQEAPSNSFIYIAIRRGPMKTPTTGTSVFTPVLETPVSGNNTVTTGFPVDLGIAQLRGSSGYNNTVLDRLRGGTTTYWNSLSTQTTSAAQTGGTITGLSFQSNTSIIDANYLYNDRGWTTSAIWWAFQRAPGFFDVVCYTGTGANRTVSHNLGVVPELMIVKSRSIAQNWPVYSAATGAGNRLRVDSNGASAADTTLWNNTAPTASVFSLGTNTESNSNTATYVAYLFASCPGVSKVGTYTGTGALQTINCGFTGGARFVLIKRTDGIGGWFVYDSARGLSSGNDPYLLLNTTDAEVTSTNYVDTTSVGFQVTAAAPAALNANGGTFVFLAIS
jgi:hypothetical protein